MSHQETQNEALIGGSAGVNAGLGGFSAFIEAAALESYHNYLIKMDGISERPLDLPEGAREMFCDGYWKGYEAGLKMFNTEITGDVLAFIPLTG